jgi:hypothetical protein
MESPWWLVAGGWLLVDYTSPVLRKSAIILSDTSSRQRMMDENLKKLSEDDYLMLENLMEKVPDPNETFTATGWHYELTAMLRQFGYRPVGRYEAYELAQKLLELGYDR